MQYIKKVKYLRGNNWIYAIEVQTFVFFWRECFSSNIKEETEKVFYELQRSPNVIVCY